LATRELLSPVQRLQFTEIPDSITTRDIARYYTLSNDELKIIKERRRPHNRLGFAVQLCYLRFPGRVWILGEIVPESVPDKKLYTFEPLPPDSVLAPLLGDKINVKLIQGSWDEILRLASSIRTGTVTASLMLRKLASYPRQNRLALALRELGRIERTRVYFGMVAESRTAATGDGGTK
jgi:TnpA family transposase